MQESTDRLPTPKPEQVGQKDAPKVVLSPLPPRELTFSVPGKPEHLRRARYRVVQPKGKKPFVQVYDPPANQNAKGSIQHAALRALGVLEIPLRKGPVGISIRAYFEVPKSKRRKRKPVAQKLRTSKPDVDNILKIYMDALTGVLWTDDDQIAYAEAFKLDAPQGERSRTEVRVIDLSKQL